MGIATIDTGKMRSQSGSSKTSTLNAGFTDYLAAATGPAATAVSLNKGYTPAAMTEAATTGIIGAQNTMAGNAGNAPYYSPMVGTASSPFSSGGYGYTGATYAPGYSTGGAGTNISYGTSGIYGSAGYGAPGVPSQ